MHLGVISRVSFGFWGDFWRKIEKREVRKIWAKRAPTPQRREPMLRCRPTPQHGMPRLGEVEVPKRAPLGYASANGLRRSVDTVHSEHISDFCFRTPCIRTPIV